MDQLYETYSPLIDTTVKSFVRRYGGHYEDLRADANSVFLRAMDQWERGEANTDCIQTHIRRWVWFTLLDEYRIRYGVRRKVKHAMIGGDVLDDIPSTNQSFSLFEFLSDLPSDARMVANLVLDMPNDIAVIAYGKGGEPRNIRSTLRQYLKNLGWANEKINKSFEDIRVALP